MASRGVFSYNIRSKEIRQFSHDPANNKSLSNNNASKLYIDSKDRLWIATGGGGVNLYSYNSREFIRFTSHNTNLKNDYVSNITESPLGYLYLTTNQGLSYINPENNGVINFCFKRWDLTQFPV